MSVAHFAITSKATVNCPTKASSRRVRRPYGLPTSAVRVATGCSVGCTRSEPRSTTLSNGWKPAEIVLAVAHDTPMVGWRGQRVNTLRLWSARAVDPIHLEAFNAGDHIGALRESNMADALSRGDIVITFSGWETIKKWAILDHDLTVESGELTPSLKVKRAVVEDNNRELLDTLFAG